MVVVVVVAHEILMSAQGPLGFGFLGAGAKGLGPGLDNNFRKVSANQHLHVHQHITLHFNSVVYLLFPCARLSENQLSFWGHGLCHDEQIIHSETINKYWELGSNENNENIIIIHMVGDIL